MIAAADESGLLLSGATRIPVRNLWLLMLYASDLFVQERSLQDVGAESAGEDLPDLVALVLVAAAEARLHRPLSRRHLPQTGDLTRVRGRIDHLRTRSRGLLAQGQVACRFDDLTVDHPVNRVIHAGLLTASRLARTADLRERAAAAARLMSWSGVSAEPVSALQAVALTLGRNDEADRRVVSAAVLLLQMAVFTEGAGTLRGQAPDRDIRRWRRLYESAIRGFYGAVLHGDPWTADSRQSQHVWPVVDPTPGMAALLPVMVTDVVLRAPGRRIVVETKFTSPTQMHSQFGNVTFKRDHLFQLHAYLTTLAVDPGERLDGVLLYPQTGAPIDESATVRGHRMRVLTLDLTGTHAQIRERLLAVIDT
ncbi:putative McrC protein [Micrococcus luteus]|uniref:5-methylcytosine restriction system specificity protein McrC n=1 Tax=Micrococcus luteus TaxID=1270 RepID=UPI000445780A|nr:hypothetical protein [Micrococcus luteus]EZP43371.1 putative McrC protein [Micrococcus luteus]